MTSAFSMALRILSVLSAFVLAVAFLMNSAMSAEFRHSVESTSEHVGERACDLFLDGNIAKGDLGKLEEKLKVARLESESAGVLCLNSPNGGSFLEAVKLAKFISKESIPTVIDSGKTCGSACAIIFMAGTGYDYGADDVSAARSLHVLGNQWFHRPYIREVDVKEKAEQEGRSIDEKLVSPTFSSGKRVDLFDLLADRVPLRAREAASAG